MAMTFNAMFNAIFDQISKRVVETYHPKKADGKLATTNDVRVVCDRVMAESFIQITFGGNDSKVLHKPEEYKACTYVIGRGERIGEECGKKAKSGHDCCSTHVVAIERSKIVKTTCQHVYTKGKNPGSVCSAVASDGKYCSKHKKKSTTASDDSGEDAPIKKVVVKVPVGKSKKSSAIVAKPPPKADKKVAVVADEVSDSESGSEVEFDEEKSDSEEEKDDSEDDEVADEE